MILLAAVMALIGLGIGLCIVKRQLCSWIRLDTAEAALPGQRSDERDRSREWRFMTRFKPRSEQSQGHIVWGASGDKHTLNVGILNVSEDGARIKSAVPLAPNTHVLIQMPGSRLAGTARVRYCEPKMFTYYIGLEFKGPLFRML
jgi:hypothetical protein